VKLISTNGRSGNGHHGNGQPDDGNGIPRILVVVAHPDDETLGAGGTVAKFAQRGSEVWVLVICDGVTARHSEVDRQKECAKRACETLGVSNVVFCDMPDQRLDTLSLVDVITPIEECVAELQPELVLTHFEEDVNQDHGVVFRATMVATRPSPGSSVQTVMCFETASSTEWAAPFPGNTFVPNVYVDIESTLRTKVDAMSVYADTHTGEVKPYPHPRSLEAIEVYAKRHGVAVGIEAAEPFMLVRGVI
jgi:LmbE family N-acetylglucosaminyl deacetylase